MPSMRLVSRSVLREIWPPFLLGFAAYTFLLLVRRSFLLTDFFVRRSATAGEVALDGAPLDSLDRRPHDPDGVPARPSSSASGRLSAESELVALRSCGVGPGAVYRPVLAAGAVLAVGVFLIYNVVLPRTNDLLTETMARMAATSRRQPRLAADVPAAAARHHPLLRPGGPRRPLARGRVPEARRGGRGGRPGRDHRGRSAAPSTSRRTACGSTSSPRRCTSSPRPIPSRYRVSWNRTQRILFAGDVARDSRARVSYEKGLRAQSFAELLRSAAKARSESAERYRLALGRDPQEARDPVRLPRLRPRGNPARRDAPAAADAGSSFALSLAILVVYYVLLSSGETWAQNGSLSPELAMWLPNLGLAAPRPVSPPGARPREGQMADPRLAPSAAARRRGRRRPPAPRPARRVPAVPGPPRPLRPRALPRRLRPGAPLGAPDLRDRRLRRPGPTRSSATTRRADVLSGYYRNFLLGIGHQVGAVRRPRRDAARARKPLAQQRGHGLPRERCFAASPGRADPALRLPRLGRRLLARRDGPAPRQPARGPLPKHHPRPPGGLRALAPPSATGTTTDRAGSGTTRRDRRASRRSSPPPSSRSSPDFRLVARTAARQADWNGTSLDLPPGLGRAPSTAPGRPATRLFSIGK